jgi:hypothetical protein
MPSSTLAPSQISHWSGLTAVAASQRRPQSREPNRRACLLWSSLHCKHQSFSEIGAVVRASTGTLHIPNLQSPHRPPLPEANRPSSAEECPPPPMLEIKGCFSIRSLSPVPFMEFASLLPQQIDPVYQSFFMFNVLVRLRPPASNLIARKTDRTPYRMRQAPAVSAHGTRRAPSMNPAKLDMLYLG